MRKFFDWHSLFLAKTTLFGFDLQSFYMLAVGNFIDIEDIDIYRHRHIDIDFYRHIDFYIDIED